MTTRIEAHDVNYYLKNNPMTIEEFYISYNKLKELIIESGIEFDTNLLCIEPAAPEKARKGYTLFIATERSNIEKLKVLFNLVGIKYGNNNKLDERYVQI